LVAGCSLQRTLSVFQRQKKFEVEDHTFADAGKVGLWTKADSVTMFDEVSYGETK